METPTPDHSSPPPTDWRAWLAAQRGRLLWFAAFVLFLVYGSFRQRYIWGVDSFGYFGFGRLLSEGRLFLPLAYESPHAAALVPWGFKLTGAHVVPEYPPGFPILLAIGHLLRAPLWVTPFCGVVSCALLFRLLQLRTSFGFALLLTAAWAMMPLTVYGSTMLMSDLVATTVLLGGLLAFRLERFALAGWILGLSVAVRPTNALFFLPFCLMLRLDRATLRFLLNLAGAAALYAVYNTMLYGAPWRTGYGNVGSSFSVSIFPQFFAFFLTTTWSVLTPIVVVPALLAFRHPTRERVFLLLWPLVLMAFFACWEAGGADKWWWARFILPGLPMLFLLAADGWEFVQHWCAQRLGRPAIVRALSVLTLAALPFLYVRFGLEQRDLWLRDTGRVNYELVHRVEATVPAGALVGSLEHASSFALYTQLTPFVPVHRESVALIDEALANGRRVFLLPEPWQRENPYIVTIFQRFAVREVARYDSPWRDLVLYELTRR